MKYRLGLDVGTNSIGWCVLELNDQDEPFRIERLGSRIFSDGRNAKDGSSNAVARRNARQMRKRRDRYLRRRQRFMMALIDAGLMPQDTNQRKALENHDPYEIRKRALDEQLAPFLVGRALFHLNQRRGFKSNRKSDRGADNESGKIKKTINKTRQQMSDDDARTFGEWLAGRHAKRQWVRARLQGLGSKDLYELYADRALIADEFDQIWAAQARFNPAVFTATQGLALRTIMLYQRPLKPVTVGRCSFYPDDERAPLALPIAQAARIYQELNSLRIVAVDRSETTLTREQRDAVATVLLRGSDVSFIRIGKLIGMPGAKFNLESDRRDKLKGNETAKELSKDIYFGNRWHELTAQQQSEIVTQLLNEENESKLLSWLSSEFQINTDQAVEIGKAKLTDGHSRLGERALSKLVPALVAEVITYDQATIKAGLGHHSDWRTGEWRERLPYYGELLIRDVANASGLPGDHDEKRYGKIGNPTVHIGLNQIRVMVNAIIDRYGHPQQITIELARELKQNQEQRKEAERKQADNQKRNEEIRKELDAIGERINAENILKMKLWQELSKEPLERCCVYTGEHISKSRLFSEEIEIEHLLPFSQTLDDSIANKSLCVRRANRYKENRTPHQAFSNNKDGYDWTAILLRAEKLPANKSWRFAENAMQRFLKDQTFLARQLNDTAYLAKVAREYLSVICPKINVSPGNLTALIRGKLGLNHILGVSGEKNRDDHRHHAVDAAVIAITEPAFLQKMARAAELAVREGRTRLLDQFEPPWPEFHADVAKAIARVVVSHKPDHGVEGALHNDTAYGIIDAEKGLAVVRKASSGFKASDIDGKSCKVRDALLRNQLLNAIAGLSDKNADDAVRSELTKRGIRHLRCELVVNVIPIKDKSSKVYKGYKPDGNYCMDIIRDEKGKWRDEVVTIYQANQPGFIAQGKAPTTSTTGAPLVMRLRKGDMLALDMQKARKIFQIVVLTEGSLSLAEHNEANTDSRNRSKEDEFKYIRISPNSLKGYSARRVFVTPLGKVYDPGFKE